MDRENDISFLLDRKFIVLYNGERNYPKEETMKLSEAFMEENVSKMLDLNVKIININYDKAPAVLEKSKRLKDYSYFIHQVKFYRRKSFPLEESIEQAMKNCMNQNVLKEFLEENGSEVINMLFTEFNLEDAKEVWMEEAEKKTKISIAMNLLDILDIETIAIKTGLSIEELNELKENRTK